MALKPISSDIASKYRDLSAQITAADDALSDERHRLRRKEGKSWGEADALTADAEAKIDQLKADRTVLLDGVELVSKLQLRNVFGKHAVAVLINMRAVIPIEVDVKVKSRRRYNKGEEVEKTVTKYAVLRVPTSDEYRVAQDALYTEPASDLISRAFDIFEELHSQLDEWYENMPENFQNAEKGEAVSEARDAVDNVRNESFEPDSYAGLLPVVCLPFGGGGSRADQCAEACELLAEVAEEAREMVGKLEDHEASDAVYAAIEWGDDGEDKPDKDDLIAMLDNMADKCEKVISEAEGIEFPGMF